MRLKYVTILMLKRDELHFSRLYLHHCISYPACHAHCTGCNSYSTREIAARKLSVWCHFAVSPIPRPPDCLPQNHLKLSKGGPPTLAWFPPETSARWAQSLSFVLACLLVLSKYSLWIHRPFQLDMMGENELRVSGFGQSLWQLTTDEGSKSKLIPPPKWYQGCSASCDGQHMPGSYLWLLTHMMWR